MEPTGRLDRDLSALSGKERASLRKVLLHDGGERKVGTLVM